MNKTNFKKYVGITSQKPEYRWNHGRAYKQNPYFNSAIEKYGWDGFFHIILYTEVSEAYAKEMEKKLTSIWNTQDRNYGYNATAGGDGTLGYKPSEETLKKLSDIRTGTKRSDDTKKLMSDHSALRRPDVRKKSDESKYKKVNAYNLDGTYLGTFISITNAAEYFNLSETQKKHIGDCCCGKRKSSGGYIWKYA